MAEKVIRIWNGCLVLMVVSVNENGTSTSIGSAGGADNSTKVDIEIDPFAGLIVDHSTDESPIEFRRPQE